MVPPAGQVGTQPSRENFLTRRFGLADKASVSMRRHCAALFLCAAATCLIEHRCGSSGAGRFRCGAEVPEPPKTAVVQMRKDGGDGAALPFLTRKLRAPRTRIKMGKQKLVHGVVNRVALQQRVANLSQGPVGLKGHKSSAAMKISVGAPVYAAFCSRVTL